MTRDYDVVVLGGGTGGYVAAIRASQLGLKTAIVEKQKLGGTCLHEGCIPTKALLKSASMLRQVQQAANFGIEMAMPKFNLQQAQARKEAVVDQLYKGVSALVKRSKIDVYHGTGRILGPSIFSPLAGTISVELDEGNEMLIPKQIIIATGAKPKTIEQLPIDHVYILDSTSALQLKQMPTSMLIVGGGVIGVEWASMLADFGVNVTIIEAAPHLLPSEDDDIAMELTRQLQEKGVTVYKNSHLQLQTLQLNDGIKVEVVKEGETFTIEAEKMLVSIGREGNVKNIGLENTDIVIERGFIDVNVHYQTKENHIYAIGDVIGGMQLAHVAAREGILAAEHIAGIEQESLRYEQIARCVYSAPEIASIGLTEQQANKQGYEVKVAKCPLNAIGKAIVDGCAEGFLKLLVDAKTDDVLGVHIIGANATELITSGAIAQLLQASSWELAQVVYPHPSLAELFGEAAQAIQGRAIHF